jgi:Na+/H+-dicarboxylate symporter
MIIAPFFTTLVVVAKLGNVSAVGRIGGKLGWFYSSYLFIIRNVFVNVLEPE